MSNSDPTPSPDKLLSVEAWLKDTAVDSSDPKHRAELKVGIKSGLAVINDLTVVVKIELTEAENQRFLADLYPVEDALGRFAKIAREFGAWLDSPDQSREKMEYFRHELRTPLTVAVGYTAVLSDQLKEAGLDEARGALNRINVEARRIVQIVVHLMTEND
jgi:signal transduction histidine kinase